MLTINIRELRILNLPMVVVAQLVRASDCDSEGRGFESPQPPCHSGVAIPPLGSVWSPLCSLTQPRRCGQMRSGETAGISCREFLFSNADEIVQHGPFSSTQNVALGVLL